MADLTFPEVPELSRTGRAGFPKSFPIPALPLGRRENGNGSRDGEVSCSGYVISKTTTYSWDLQ